MILAGGEVRRALPAITTHQSPENLSLEGSKMSSNAVRSHSKQSKPQPPATAQQLLKWHRQHQGIYARVARRLEVDPSFVSRVATGERKSDTISHALVSEIQRIQKHWPGTVSV